MPKLPRFHVDIATARGAPVALRDQPAPEAGLFDGSKRGLGLSSRSYRMQDGSSATRAGLVGSWPLMPGMNAGVGLFSVTHDDQKEPEFRRSWSVKNVNPRNRNIAAVGVNLHF